MTVKKTFSDLGLSATLLEAINKKGFEEPTEIQALTIPALLTGKENVIAQAQTGTGKTAAFGLPLIDLINGNSKHTEALVLVPTRELANQVSEEINSLKGKKSIGIVPIYGGQSIDEQFRRLKRHAHIVVGTPGRVIDHLERKTLLLDNIQYLILDEADEMLNMGFFEDVERILSHTKPEKRILMFSATMPDRIKELTKNYFGEYKLLCVKKDQLTTSLTEQIYFEVKASDKFEALCRLIDMESEFYGLVFCRTKMDVDEVVTHLIDRGYGAEALHGDISQSQRERTLDKFRKQRINVLVATDVAARGIDISNLSHVINYALPQDPEAYVHRIGRTGRAGNMGTAITFITPSEYSRLMFIQKLTKTNIKKSKVPGVGEIIKAKKSRISDDVTAILGGELEPHYCDFAEKLLDGKDPQKVVAALLNYCFEDDFKVENYSEIWEPGKRNPPIDAEGKSRLFVALGKKDKMTPRKLTDLIMSRVNVPFKNIRDILIMEDFSFVTVPFDAAEKIIHSFREKGKKALFSPARAAKNEGR